VGDHVALTAARRAVRQQLGICMSRVRAYRQYAADCLALAERTPGGPDRHSLIEMAASWHELALLLENYTEERDGTRTSEVASGSLFVYPQRGNDDGG
jgi:hypothetical protein